MFITVCLFPWIFPGLWMRIRNKIADASLPNTPKYNVCNVSTATIVDGARPNRKSNMGFLQIAGPATLVPSCPNARLQNVTVT
eukprot:9475488-Pyramimonas_sp.AAC.2